MVQMVVFEKEMCRSLCADRFGTCLSFFFLFLREKKGDETETGIDAASYINAIPVLVD
jgi:hypothetical protein